MGVQPPRRNVPAKSMAVLQRFVLLEEVVLTSASMLDSPLHRGEIPPAFRQLNTIAWAHLGAFVK
jgi:hypothetical protein